jgi:hypothetical protein
MHRTLLLALLVVDLAGPALIGRPAAAAQTPSPPTPPGAAQSAPAQPGLPHAWLFGSWTGGLFPPPVSLSAQECLASPSVIFTRDAVLRASPTDVTYIQSLVETVRAIPGGVEFRLARPSQSVSTGGAFGLGPDASSPEAGFGCAGPDLLRVQRRGEDLISFPNCSDFPYPLVRCPAR